MACAFSVGDTVTVLPGGKSADSKRLVGQTGTVTKYFDDYCVLDIGSDSGMWLNEIEKAKGGKDMTKRVWEVMVIDKGKDEIILKEIVIDGDEKSACSKVSISFASKLKDFVFDNLHYIARELGSYEKKEKK